MRSTNCPVTLAIQAGSPTSSLDSTPKHDDPNSISQQIQQQHQISAILEVFMAGGIPKILPQSPQNAQPNPHIKRPILCQEAKNLQDHHLRN